MPIEPPVTVATCLCVCGFGRFTSFRHEGQIGEQLGRVSEDLAAAPSDVLKVVAGASPSQLSDDPVHSAVKSGPRNSAYSPRVSDLRTSEACLESLTGRCGQLGDVTPPLCVGREVR